MSNVHNSSLLYTLYAAEFRTEFLADFARKLPDCCRRIIYGDKFFTQKKSDYGKRSRPSWYNPAPELKLSRTSDIRRSRYRSMEYYDKLKRPFLTHHIEGLLHFELNLVFNNRGAQLKEELSNIIDVIRNMTESDFEIPDKWLDLTQNCRISRDISEFNFTKEVWNSLFMCLDMWCYTKDFNTLNAGINLIILALAEEDLNCVLLTDDTGENLVQSLMFPESAGLSDSDCISDDTYLLML
mgnify:CR=1 FL=1